MSDIESINLDKLDNYLTKSQPRYETIDTERLAVAQFQVDVLSRCGSRGVLCGAVGSSATHITNMMKNHQDAQNLYDLLSNRDPAAGDLTTSEILDALGADAMEKPDNLDIEENELYGLPPHSGYMDDPICAANGNFIQIETDLVTPGFGMVTDIVRTYNSLAAADRIQPGRFGWGWSSKLDMRVDLSAAVEDSDGKFVGTVRVVLADGGSVHFTADADGNFPHNDLRQLSLHQAENGWTLRKGWKQAWTFNADGDLTGGTDHLSTWIIVSTASTVTITETNSERSVQHQLNADGLVTTAIASDGRRVEYVYEDGHCVLAKRAIGDVTYEIVNDLVETIRDADGVLVCTNDYDSRGRTLGQLSPHGRHTNYEYLPNGVTRVSDPVHGRTNVLIHDRLGNLTSMFDGNGASLQSEYDHRSRATSVTDRSGNTTRFVYADSPTEDLLLERIDPDGLSERREYDDLNRVVRQVLRDGGVRTWAYEGDDQLPTLITEPDGGELHFTWTERGLAKSLTDADGISTEWMWDNDGQPVAVTNSAGERTVHIYDATGQLVKTIDPMGRETTRELDAGGRPVSLTNVNGHTEHLTLTAAGRAVSGVVIDGPGSWTATFGDHGKMSSVSDITGATVTFEYDDVGQLIKSVAPDGLAHELEYDQLGQLIAATGPTGLRSTQTWDRAGRMASVTDVEGATLRREVDAMGRTTASIAPDGATTSWTWHPNGEMASQTLPNGDTFSYEVDAMGRLTAEVGPDGGRTTRRYSPAGRLLEWTSRAGRVFRYTYDAAGRMHTVTDPDGRVTEHERRGDGELDRIVSPTGITTMLYNAADELVDSTTNAHGIVPETLHHFGAAASNADALRGQFVSTMSTAQDNAAVIGWDGRGLVQHVTDPGGVTTRFERDARGRLTSATTNDHAQHLQWGPTGLLEGFTDALGQTRSYSHSPGGHLLGVHYENGLGRDLKRDAAGRITSITTPNGSPLAAYDFDALGQVRSATNEHGTVTVDHNLYGLVSRTTGLDGTTVTYNRDEDGLLTSRSTDAGHSTEYLRNASGDIIGQIDSELGPIDHPVRETNPIDVAGRFTSDTRGSVYSYDSAGRLAESLSAEGDVFKFTYNDLGLLATDTTPTHGRRTFNYDLAGQLERVAGNTGSTTFEYDIAGRRTREVNGDGSSVTYVWNDLDQIIRVDRTDATGQVSSRHITWSALNRPERVDELTIGWDDVVTHKPVRIGERRWMRSGRLLREAVADSVWHDGSSDDPWGHGTDAETSGVTLGYRGELSIDGLIFMGARVYDPSTRSFLSRDPLPTIVGVNAFAGAYVYAWNDPVNFADPTGLQPLSMEEFEEVLAERERSRFGSAWERVKEDPLGAALLVTVLVVGTVLLIPPATALGAATLGVAGGLIIGAGATAAIGIHNKDFNPSKSAINGLVGGATGALGPFSWPVQAAGGAAFAAAGDVLNQGLNDHTGLDGLLRTGEGEWMEDGYNPWETVAAGVGGGLVIPGLGPGAGNRLAAMGLGAVASGFSDGLNQVANGTPIGDLDWTSIGISSGGGALGESFGGRTAGGNVDIGSGQTSNPGWSAFGDRSTPGWQNTADNLRRPDAPDFATPPPPPVGPRIETDLAPPISANNWSDEFEALAPDLPTEVTPITADEWNQQFESLTPSADTPTVTEGASTPSSGSGADGYDDWDRRVARTERILGSSSPEPVTPEPVAPAATATPDTPAPEAAPPRDPQAGMVGDQAGRAGNGEIIQMAP